MSEFTHTYIGDCAGLGDGDAINAMRDVAEAALHEEMAEHCDLDTLAERLGYDEELRLQDDWHVAYYKSTYEGRDCFYLVWSAFEHIFVEGE